MQKFLFITDLDASLLWHDYSYEEAKPTLAKLKELDYPLILNSSKTLSELEALASELGSTAPVIAENGGAVCIHHASPLAIPENAKSSGDYSVVNAGISREFVLQKAHSLRTKNDYKFEGFFDWSPAELSAITKLSQEGAARAKTRFVTEPILWHDTEDRLTNFQNQLAEHDIKVIRGGKFTHLMGQVDKADGALLATNLYKSAHPDIDWTTVAIGDSENDLLMLEQADIAVVIPHDGDIRIRPSNPNTIYAQHDASLGWAESVNSIINTSL